MTEGTDTPYHAAHTITMRIATMVARLAMMTTKRRISRCRVVIDAGAAEDSLAMRPLWMARVRQKPTSVRLKGREAETHNTVLSPIWKTRPRPDPLTQSVPCSAMFFV
jgi:hypothetical protein